MGCDVWSVIGHNINRSCTEEPHDPCDCETWKKWQHHIEDMRPQIGDKSTSQLDNAASQKWLAKRSKPCPKCK